MKTFVGENLIVADAYNRLVPQGRTLVGRHQIWNSLIPRSMGCVCQFHMGMTSGASAIPSYFWLLYVEITGGLLCRKLAQSIIVWYICVLRRATLVRALPHAGLNDLGRIESLALIVGHQSSEASLDSWIHHNFYFTFMDFDSESIQSMW